MKLNGDTVKIFSCKENMSKGIITDTGECGRWEKGDNLVLYFKMSDQDKLNSDMREYMLKNGFTVTGFYSICEA